MREAVLNNTVQSVSPLWDLESLEEWGEQPELLAAKNVLIVEDDSSTVSLFKTMIHNFDEDALIKSIPSAEVAEKYLRELKRNGLPGPDVAMIDYRLSGKDGLYVCHILETYFPLTKIVLVSGMSHEEVSRKIQEHHLKIEFLQKPIERRQILHILQTENIYT